LHHFEASEKKIAGEQILLLKEHLYSQVILFSHDKQGKETQKPALLLEIR